MKRAWLGRGAVLIVVLGVSWANVGVERIAGDHEVGDSWQSFVKHRPSPRLVFENPAARGLELTPVESMPPAERAAFLDYCDIRFGAADAAQCQALLRKRVL